MLRDVFGATFKVERLMNRKSSVAYIRGTPGGLFLAVPWRKH